MDNLVENKRIFTIVFAIAVLTIWFYLTITVLNRLTANYRANTFIIEIKQAAKKMGITPEEMAVMIYRDIPRETIEQEDSTIISDYLSTKEGKKLNEVLLKYLR